MISVLLAIIYLAFISLGLPDSILGSAWPTIYPEFHVPVSYAGILSMIIAAGTIFSSLQSDRLSRRLGAGKVTALSVATTAVALFGFSISHSFVALCLWAVPYGLGAGSVDAALNNYVALHYKSTHMNWLHCMWGVGATLGPCIMGQALSRTNSWAAGYRTISLIQVVLTAILVFSLPLWKLSRAQTPKTTSETAAPLTLKQILKMAGAKEVTVCFFCYCALESTVSLWAGSYLTLFKGVSAEEAASYAGLFFIGITVGRGASGFVAIKLSDTQMIRMGQVLIAVGAAVMLLPGAPVWTLLALAVIGLGCAPIYPCIIHATPAHFGTDKSQQMIGVQMASAYVGSCIMPPLFGLVANHITVALLPVHLLVLLALMATMHELLVRKAPIFS